MTLRGVPEWEAAVTRLEEEVGLAAERAVDRGARAQKRRVQANISGPPRWVGHQHQPRSGGPGEQTGRLRAAVTATRKGRKAEVRVRSRYATKTEERYPFFEPGIRAAEREVGRGFLEAYTEALI